jgi:hypothetical protein
VVSLACPVCDSGDERVGHGLRQSQRSATATPRVAALLLERKAWAHAVAGDYRQADTALNLAREALHRDDDRPEPDWVFWVDEREIDIMGGRCWTELRKSLRAVPVLESV